MGFYHIAYFLSGLAVTAIGLVLHHAKVVPLLKEHGARRWTGSINVRLVSELFSYRRICLAEKTSVRWWYILICIHILQLAWFVGLAALLLPVVAAA
jgi:hypothetical protein